MANEGNALPWFPLTPDYIDKYNESVIKYLKDEASSPERDKSFSTTVTLLHQRSQQLLDTFYAMPLIVAQALGETLLMQYVKTVASDAFLLHSEGEDAREMTTLLAYLISLFDRDLTDEMSSFIVKMIHSDGIVEMKYGLDDIVSLDMHSLAESLQKTELKASKEPVWFESKGTIKVDAEGVSIYDINRSFIGVREKNGGAFRKDEIIHHLPVSLKLDKKDKREFSFNRYLADLATVVPSVDSKTKFHQENN